MPETLRVGVVGGGIGRQHLEAYRSLPGLFEMAAICDADETKAREVAQAYAIPRVLTDVGALCELEDLDVVDICTPPYLHVRQTLQALAAGKHVICEKPLAGSLEDADQVAAAEKRSGRRVMPIFQYRFGHGIQKLRRLVEEGIAGRAYLTTVETAWRRRRPTTPCRGGRGGRPSSGAPSSTSRFTATTSCTTSWGRRGAWPRTSAPS